MHVRVCDVYRCDFVALSVNSERNEIKSNINYLKKRENNTDVMRKNVSNFCSGRNFYSVWDTISGDNNVFFSCFVTRENFVRVRDKVSQ